MRACNRVVSLQRLRRRVQPGKQPLDVLDSEHRRFRRLLIHSRCSHERPERPRWRRLASPGTPEIPHDAQNPEERILGGSALESQSERESRRVKGASTCRSSCRSLSESLSPCTDEGGPRCAARPRRSHQFSCQVGSSWQRVALLPDVIIINVMFRVIILMMTTPRSDPVADLAESVGKALLVFAERLRASPGLDSSWPLRHAISGRADGGAGHLEARRDSGAGVGRPGRCRRGRDDVCRSRHGGGDASKQRVQDVEEARGTEVGGRLGRPAGGLAAALGRDVNAAAWQLGGPERG